MVPQFEEAINLSCSLRANNSMEDRCVCTSGAVVPGRSQRERTRVESREGNKQLYDDGGRPPNAPRGLCSRNEFLKKFFRPLFGQYYFGRLKVLCTFKIQPSAAAGFDNKYANTRTSSSYTCQAALTIRFQVKWQSGRG
jgi:hypothetical protein